MKVMIEVTYDDDVTLPSRTDDQTRQERFAAKIAEDLADKYDAGDMPWWDHARRIVAWVGEPAFDTSLVPTVGQRGGDVR